MTNLLQKMHHRLPKSVKSRLRASLWSIFTQTDEAFAINIHSVQAGNREEIVGGSLDAATLEPALVQAPRTLVVNDYGIITSEDGLFLFVSSLFETRIFTPTQRSVFENLRGHSALWVDQDLLVKSAQEFLRSKLAEATPAEGTAIASCLQSIYQHQEKTGQSRSAYSHTGKTNPNAVFWPDPTYTKQPRSLFTEQPFARESKFIYKETPIGSAGSCFAMEIAHRLQSEGFNYTVTEPWPGQDGHSNSCARWGIIFNTPSFRQLVEKAFGVRSLPRILWSQTNDGHAHLHDPFREDIAFSSVEEYEVDYEAHIRAARQAFLQTEVFVFTLGMNEVWRLKADGSVFSRAPWKIAPALVERKVLTVEDNVRELQAMLDILRRHNPHLKIILSVSPVPLHATFRGEEYHVISANSHSKSLLRVAAEEFARRNADVYYFPSYEVVMYCVENAWESDQRHVSREAVTKVMALFRTMFVAESVVPA